MRKINIFFLIVFLFFLLFPLSSLALKLQLRYPQIKIGGQTYGINANIRLHELARFIYYFSVILGGVLAFLGFLLAGFRYITSRGNPIALSEAKKQIHFSFLGTIILLSSWLILYTLDPNFTRFPLFDKPAHFSLPKVPPLELTDGIIFYTDHPDFPAIPVPYGAIRVEDTRRFPVGMAPAGITTGGTTVDLDGRDDQGKIRRHPITRSVIDPHVTEISIFNPISQCPSYPKCPLKYEYGVACFEYPNYQGRVAIYYSYDSGYRKVIFGVPVSGGNILSLSQACTPTPMVLPYLLEILPCGSILVFRVPYFSIHNPSTDKIIFYEHPYLAREEKDPLTLQKKIVGECYKLDTTPKPENCSAFGPGYLDLLSLDIDLRMEVIDPKTGKHIRDWLPKSVEIKTDKPGKYLIFFFQLGKTAKKLLAPPELCPFERGNAYWFTSDVDDFWNDKLYWTRTILPGGSRIIYPSSAIIFQTEQIF